MIDTHSEQTSPKRVDTLHETDVKCPGCAGTMDFDPKTEGLLCPYCGYAQAIERGCDAAEISLSHHGNVESQAWGSEKKKVICKNCSAESVYDALQLSSECPYCGSNQVMETTVEEAMVPNGITPFKIDAQEASALFGKWLKGRIYCPRAAKRKGEPDAINAVYLPYWTFDSQASVQYAGEYGKRRKVRTKDGKTRTVTDWYSMRGKYGNFIDDILVCGTTRHDERELEKLQLDARGSIEYKPEYLSGFAAEQYSVGLRDAFSMGQKRMINILRDEVTAEVRARKGASEVRFSHFDVQLDNLTYKYVLLPVWLSTFLYKNKVYQSFVNGETGYVAGRLPLSAPKILLTVFIVLGVFILLGHFILQFLRG